MKQIMLVLVLQLLLAACSDTASRCYYLDAETGNDTNTGLSPEKAWKTTVPLQSILLSPGDKILLKRGSLFQGPFEFSAQGTVESPICIDAYGDGDVKPCIVGADSSLCAMRIYNSDYVTVQNLEIVNTGKQRLACRSGLKVECSDYGVSHNIVVNSLTIRDVNGSLVKEEGGGCGLLIKNGGEKIVSFFDGLTIENCHILRCARNAMIWDAYSSRANWHPSLHTVVRSNLIEEVPGDGIVPIGCDSTLIEYNVMRNCPDILPDTEAAAGIWPWSCDNTLIQYNEVSGHKAPWDAQGFDSDWNCEGTIIQYNYSHDNYGGLVLICNNGEADEAFSLGNRGTIVRYNISIGDGIRPKQTRQGMFSPNIHIAGPVKNTLVERNIVHSNIKPAKDIDRTMIVSDSWGGYADSTIFRQNIFYASETSGINLTESTQNVFDGNWFLGEFQNRPENHDIKSAIAIYQERVLDIDPRGYGGLHALMKVCSVSTVEGLFVDSTAIESLFEALDK